MRKVVEICAKNDEKDDQYTASTALIFPNESADSMIQNMSPAILLTTEFDYYRKAAEEVAVKFLDNKKLLEYGCIGGTFHNSYANFDL